MTVSATPTGYADAIVFPSHGDVKNVDDVDNVEADDVETDDAAVKFVMPHEDVVTMNEFLDIIEEPTSSPGIHYIQKQVFDR